MYWIPVALIAAYAVFVFGPALAAYVTIFRGRPGSGVEALTKEGAQFAPYAEPIRAAYANLSALPKTDVSIRADDGTVLSGEYYDLGRTRTAIFVHGYRTEPYVNFSVQCEAFLRHGFNLLLMRSYR